MSNHKVSTRRVIIATVADDLHAAVVSAALNEIGWSCDRWISSDLPSKQLSTIDIYDAPCIHVSSDDGQISIPLPLGDIVFWNRRRTDQLYIDTSVHPADVPIAERESIALRDNILSLLGTAAHQVNDFSCARRAESKCLQLFTAKSFGLSVPRTRVSNSTAEIREFIRSCSATGCIAKSFRAPIWISKDKTYVGYSAIVSEDDLGDEDVIRSCPGIFQEYIRKKFDVRVTCFGDNLLAVKLASRGNARAEVDWRALSREQIEIEKIELPGNVMDKCKRLMASFGLQFACIDFAVTSAEEWYFLEINQMGQFLFVEKFAPEIHLLDMFVQLLTHVHPVRNEHYGINFTDVAPKAYELLKEEKGNRARKLTPGLVHEAPDSATLAVKSFDLAPKSSRGGFIEIDPAIPAVSRLLCRRLALNIEESHSAQGATIAQAK